MVSTMASYAVQQAMFSMFTDQRSNKTDQVHNGEYPSHNITTAQTGDGFHSVLGRPEKDSKSRYSNIEEGLESSLGVEAKNRINRILAETHQLSDVEKLLLYLKLPSGSVSDDPLRQTPPSCLHTSNRTEQAQAFTWIRSHLEEDNEICLPKQEVYNDYWSYCQSHDLKALCTADFGKVMKCVFPNVKPRRLGQRGQSRYCYGGLRKKLDITPPVLPELEIQNKKAENETKEDDEVFSASCQLVCEWARKLLTQNFQNVRELAEHLVANIYVNSKSVAAFTVIAAMQEAGIQNSKVSALFNSSSSGDKHRETQLQLQRKLQEREQLKEQKRKLQQQREELELQMRSSSSQDCKTPVRSSSTLECKTPICPVSSADCKTPKLPSPLPSPLPLQSPSKYKLSKTHSDSTFSYIQPQVQQGMKLVEMPLRTSRPSDKNDTEEVNMDVSIKQPDRVVVVTAVPTATGQEEWVISSAEKTDRKSSSSDYEMELDENIVDIRTPEKDGKDDIDIESKLGSNTGVRSGMQELVEDDNRLLSDSQEQLSVSATSTCIKEEVIILESSGNEEQFQNLSLKTLLERKDLNENNLNQSLGFSLSTTNSSSNNSALFVNQSNIPSRSAFVPFSQVQSRKESNLQVSQSITAPIPVMIPSNIKPNTNQSISGVYKLEAVPSSKATVSVIPIPKSLPSDAAGVKSGVHTSSTEGIITILPIAQVSTSSDATSKCSTALIPVNYTVPVTATSMFTETTMSSGCTNLVSVASSAVSSSTSSTSVPASRPVKSRFAPIRPKASPVKPGQLVKDQKGNVADIPSYDKRPVAAILKEKRAREAEAMVKQLQNNLVVPNLQTVSGLQFQSGLPVNSQGTVGNISGIPADLLNIPVQGGNSAKEVVIIVNNTLSAGSGVPPVLNTTHNQLTSAYVAQTPPETNDTQKESNSIATHGLNKDDMKTTVSGPVELVEEKKNKDMSSEFMTDSKYAEALSQLAETPVKIAKLDITSPFRPDSACSLGRETPIKVKMNEPVLSRPESACSMGRETPSGGRKRKSTDIAQRRNYKRLNSTGEGEEGEEPIDVDEFSTGGHISYEMNFDKTVRRAQSCTFDTEKDIVKQKPGVINKDALQSPDITSLEREALIDTFLQTAIPPQKSTVVQRSSVGVNARSLRHSQQKLITQQHVLNERMKNFLQKDENPVGPGPKTAGLVESFLQNTHGSASTRPNSMDVCQNFNESRKAVPPGKLGLIENNELPSDVAEFIAEALDKRQMWNQSAMSEPDPSVMSHCRQLSFSDSTEQRHVSFSDDTESASLMDTADANAGSAHSVSSNNQSNASLSDSGLPHLNFDLDKELTCTSQSRKETLLSLNQRNRGSSKDSENIFTVPKAPPANSRLAGSKPLSSDLQNAASANQQRCSSLPSFTVKSPIQQQRNSSFQRALSMSPQVLPNRSPERDIVSPVSKITSPFGRIEVRENHPISVHVHNNSAHRGKDESMFARPTSLPVKGSSNGDEGRAPSTPYLASIQHSLQKPGDVVDFQSSQFVTASPVTRNQLSRESSTERTNFHSTTPFSDPGYHSIGGSPIMNSTPVSCVTEGDVSATSSSGSISQLSFGAQDSQTTMQNTIGCSPVPHSTTSSVQFTNIIMSPKGIQAGMIAQGSSNSSMFIPIQGSNNDIRYVRPIRPTVTVANSSQAFAGDSIPSQNNTATAFVLSPKSQDPPSYESAIKFLRQPCQTVQQQGEHSTATSTVVNMEQQGSVPMNEQSTNPQQAQSSPLKSQNRASLLADMGSCGEAMLSPGSLPFSSKLAQLSRQTVDQTSPTKHVSPAILAAFKDNTRKSGRLLFNDLKDTSGGTSLELQTDRAKSNDVIQLTIPPQDDTLDLCVSIGAENIDSTKMVGSSQSVPEMSTHINMQQNMSLSGANVNSPNKRNPAIYQTGLKTVPLYCMSNQSYQANEQSGAPNFSFKNVIPSVLSVSPGNPSSSDPSFLSTSTNLDLQAFLGQESVELSQVLGKPSVIGKRDHELNEEELWNTWEDLKEIEGVSTGICLDGEGISSNPEMEDSSDVS